VPLLKRAEGDSATGWTQRPAITGKLLSKDEHHDSESFAIVSGGWKLVHNVIRAPGMADFELYDFAKDPLDQKDVSAEHPDVVAQPSAEMPAWQRIAEAQRVKRTRRRRRTSAPKISSACALGCIQ